MSDEYKFPKDMNPVFYEGSDKTKFTPLTGENLNKLGKAIVDNMNQLARDIPSFSPKTYTLGWDKNSYSMTDEQRERPISSKSVRGIRNSMLGDVQVNDGTDVIIEPFIVQRDNGPEVLYKVTSSANIYPGEFTNENYFDDSFIRIYMSIRPNYGESLGIKSYEVCTVSVKNRKNQNWYDAGYGKTLYDEPITYIDRVSPEELSMKIRHNVPVEAKGDEARVTVVIRATVISIYGAEDIIEGFDPNKYFDTDRITFKRPKLKTEPVSQV